MAVSMRTVADHAATSALIAGYVAYKGWKRGSLSASGSLTAVVVGFVLLHARTKAFGIAMLVLFFGGSKATRVGKALKAKLEDGHAEAGNRNAWQVLCNSITAVLAGLAWSALFAPDSIYGALLPSSWGHYQTHFNSSAWCPTTTSVPLTRPLGFAVLGYFGCCLGDTFASELGILSKSWPRLITTFQRVPPGTNGGMSTVGTAASAAGGFLIGLSFAIVHTIESAACREDIASLWIDCCLWGSVAGLVGSLIDSFLGATLQLTRYDKEKKLILQDDMPDRGSVTVVSGIKVLTNNQINLIAATLTSVIVAYLA